METNNPAHQKEEENVFSLNDFLMACLAKWQWFVCSVIIFLGIGILYILRQQPTYVRTTTVLVKSNEDGASAVDMETAFSSLGFGSSSAKVNNELIAMTSPAVMAQVVDLLKLTVNYAEKGTFHPTTLYGESCPIVADFIGLGDEQGASLRMTLHPDGSYELYKFRTMVDGEKMKYDDEVHGKLGFNTVKTPLGPMLLKPNAKFTGKIEEDMDLIISRSGFQSTVESYMGRLQGDLADQDAEVIDLSFKDVSIPRAVDVLNAVVDVYNNEWMLDKNKISKATSKFIDERLISLEQELSQVDGDISEYRSSNNMADLDKAAQVYLEAVAKSDESKLEIENQLAVAEYFLDFMKNPTHKGDVMPMNLGFENTNLSSQIAEYNSIVIMRDNMLQKSSPTNPLVKQYDEQIATLRAALYSSVVSIVGTLKSALANLDNAKGENDQKLTAIPTQAKFILSVERKQKVMEELYLFLLQKREENELSQTFTASNTRVLTPPYGSLTPVSPKKGLILVVCFILGLAFPGMVVYLIASGDNKVRSRRDIDNLQIPFAGEIPFVGKKDSKLAGLFRSKKKNKKLAERPKPIIEAGKRDVPNEAFRVVRSNLEFMVGKEKGCHVVMLTSFNPGSGKSFIVFNLGASFGLKHKRVLLIDGDLRHGSLSTYVGSPKRGLTNYLTGATEDWKSLLVNIPEFPTVDMMPLGNMPPNPAELLENGALGKLIEQAREDYDYILLDCPPIDIVVDTQIIERYTDRTMFVVRAGLLDKRAIFDISELYDSKKYKHMSLILNGTDSAHSRYYTYGTYEGVTAE